MTFIVATGIECSAPVIDGGIRRDQLLLTGHWTRVEEDLDLVVAHGLSYLRYGIPFHVVDRDPAARDWAWTDRAMAAMRERSIEPIVDLLHFAVPDDLSGVSDPRLPERYVAYVRAFVDRYPWVRWYTPVNEPYITAMYSAYHGWWNERETGDRAFVRALTNVATCAVEGTAIIRGARPDAVFLQSDACESFRPSEPQAASHARHLTERGYLGFDLTYGRPVSDEMKGWLLECGMEQRLLDWFMEHGTSDNAIVGLDYYPMNEHLVLPSGMRQPVERRGGFAPIARSFHQRYGLPIMLAETNTHSEQATLWLRETWNDTVALAESGIPVAGFCWYSLTDQVDWDTCLREANGTINSFGLVDLERARRPVSSLYEWLARTTARLGAPPLASEDGTAA